MHYRRIACLLIGLALSLSACNEFKVQTDHDSTADFSAFKTFAFAGLADVNKGGIYDNSLMQKRVETAVGRELSAKGLRQVGLDEHPPPSGSSVVSICRGNSPCSHPAWDD